MRPDIVPRRCFGAIVILLTQFVIHGVAGEIRVQTSDEETYVGMPVTVAIVMANFSDHEPPLLEAVDGLQMRSQGPPEIRRTVSNRMGKRTESNLRIYRFSVTPLRAGDFVIPPVQIKGDGTATLTRAIRIHATQSEVGDLLFASVSADPSVCYVGQPLQLKLTIDVLPYRDSEFQIKLKANDHWQLFTNKNHWGVFTESLEQLRSRRGQPQAEIVQRQNAAGETQAYYRYVIQASIYPDHPGPVELDDLRIIAHYPTELDRSQSPLSGSPFGNFFDDASFPFGSRLKISKVRPLLVEPDLPAFDIQPIPKNAPVDYRGAVGRYSISIAAAPVQINANDPIEVQLVLESLGQDRGTMKWVQPPPLADIASLTKDFKVSDEPIGGLIKGNTKLFQTTIRPRSETVSEIPPIPFTFFDPDKAAFETVYTSPIQIDVQESDVLALDPMGDNGLPFKDRDERSELSDPSATTSSVQVPKSRLTAGEASAIKHLKHPSPAIRFTARQPFSLMWLWSCLIGFPVATFLVWIISIVKSRFYLGGVKRLIHQIDRAESGEEIGERVLTHLRRWMQINSSSDLPFGGLDQVVGGMRTRGLSSLANECERVVANCQGADNSRLPLITIKQQAIELAGELSVHRGKLAQSPTRSTRVISVAGLPMALVFLFPGSMLASESLRDHQLDQDARQRLIVDTLERMEQAMSQEEPSTRARELRTVLTQFQTLSSEGVIHSDILVLTARCKRELGEPASAIADYLEALQITPDNGSIRRDLESTSRLLTPPRRYFLLPSITVNWSYVAPSKTWAILAVLFWGVAWGAVSLKLLGLVRRYKTIFVWGVLSTLAATMICIDRMTPQQLDQHAIVTADFADLRQGDGEDFATIVPQAASQGEVVRVLRRRGEWSQVEVGDQAIGWEYSHKFAPIGNELSNASSVFIRSRNASE